MISQTVLMGKKEDPNCLDGKKEDGEAGACRQHAYQCVPFNSPWDQLTFQGWNRLSDKFFETNSKGREAPQSKAYSRQLLHHQVAGWRVKPKTRPNRWFNSHDAASFISVTDH